MNYSQSVSHVKTANSMLAVRGTHKADFSDETAC